MLKFSLLTILSRLSKRERLIAYSAGLILALFILDVSILSPVLGKIDELNEEIKFTEETIRQSMIIVSQRERITEIAGRFQPYLSEIDTEEKEVTAFLKEIESLAKDAYVYVVDIRPSGKVEEGISKQYFLDLDLEGEMESIMRFFYAIENSEKLFRIGRYRLRPKQEGSQVASCNMSVSKILIPK